MTKIHIASMLLLTIVSSIFAMPYQKTDELQTRLNALETTVSLLSERVSKLEVSDVVTPQPSSEQNPSSDSDISEVDYEVVSIDAKITESNNIYDKHSWILAVKNNGRQRLLFNATIDFLDKDGFIVDQDFGLQLLLEPYETKDFIGTKLVNAAISGNIVKISAKTTVVDVQDVASIATPTTERAPELNSMDGEPALITDTVVSTSLVIVREKYGVNARNSPSSDSEPIEVLAEGTQLIILDEETNSEGRWYKVQLQDDRTAWVSSAFVDVKNHEDSKQGPKGELDLFGDSTFTTNRFEISIDGCEYQSTSDDKSFDRYICTETWQNKSSKWITLNITIHLYDMNEVELTSSGEIKMIAADSSSKGKIKVLVDYPQAEQVAKYGVSVEEQ